VAADYARDHRFEILAKGIPARTNGIAANPIDELRLNNFHNRNMPGDLAATTTIGGKVVKTWFTSYKGDVPWGHGHFLDVAYIYVYPMHKKLVEDGGLR